VSIILTDGIDHMIQVNAKFSHGKHKKISHGMHVILHQSPTC